jgi:hypothetical protein
MSCARTHLYHQHVGPPRRVLLKQNTWFSSSHQPPQPLCASAIKLGPCGVLIPSTSWMHQTHTHTQRWREHHRVRSAATAVPQLHQRSAPRIVGRNSAWGCTTCPFHSGSGNHVVPWWIARRRPNTITDRKSPWAGVHAP